MEFGFHVRRLHDAHGDLLLSASLDLYFIQLIAIFMQFHSRAYIVKPDEKDSLETQLNRE